MLIRTLLFYAFALAAVACGPGRHLASEGSFAARSTSICDVELKSSFQKTYHPFLLNNCAACHSSAHASSNVDLAYRAFMERGTTLIDYQATHAHGGNSLSATDTQPQIDAFKPQWVQAQNQYLDCLVKNSGSAVGAKFALAGKPIPNLMNTANNTTWIPVEWDLESQAASPAANGQFKAFFKAEARLQVVSGVPSGIIFRNPSLRLKSGSQNIEVKALTIMIDGDTQNLVTTYSTIAAIVNSTSDTVLVSNSSSALAYYPGVSATTQVAFIIEHIRHTTQSPTPPTPGPLVPVIPYPVPEVPVPPGGVKFSELISGSSPYRVFARSCTGCHNSGNMSGNLDLTNYDAARSKASTIQSRMNNSASPMPPSGLLRQNDRDMVNSWISFGTPN